MGLVGPGTREGPRAGGKGWWRPGLQGSPAGLRPALIAPGRVKRANRSAAGAKWHVVVPVEDFLVGEIGPQARGGYRRVGGAALLNERVLVVVVVVVGVGFLECPRWVGATRLTS